MLLAEVARFQIIHLPIAHTDQCPHLKAVFPVMILNSLNTKKQNVCCSNDCVLDVIAELKVCVGHLFFVMKDLYAGIWYLNINTYCCSLGL